MKAKPEKTRATSSRTTARRQSPTPKSSTSAAPSELTHRLVQLKVTLMDAEPSIWRRFLAPGQLSLNDLHTVLQIAFEWTNSHLHQFYAPDRSIFYSNPLFELDESGTQIIDEFTVRVGDVLGSPKRALIYEYDFGDSWTHYIEFEKGIDDDTVALVPQCIGGQRAGPPDDCGGVWGYRDLLEIIKNPKHEEYEQMVSWLIGMKSEFFDPDVFEMEYANRWLARAFKTLSKRRREESWWFRARPAVVGWRKVKLSLP